MVEHVLGKNGVVGSSPILGSRKMLGCRSGQSERSVKPSPFWATGVRIPPPAPEISKQ